MIQSVERAAVILKELGSEGGRLGVTELSERLGLAKATIYGLLRALEAHQMVEQDAETGKYRLGPALLQLGNAFLDKMDECGWRPEAVGGLTMGADPVAMAIARESLERSRAINAFVVRKESKKHGLRRFIEGLEMKEGVKVVVIDDVCSTGESTVTAITRAREAGMIVLGALCLVDREMGARQNIEGALGCAFDSIFTLSELQGVGSSTGTGLPLGTSESTR